MAVTPRETTSRESGGAGATPEAAFEAGPSDALKVIVVDDDMAARRGLEKAARLFGYQCRSAGDGEEALAMHRQERADIIVSDWQMPHMDGLELCRRARAVDEDRGYTYFIVTTARCEKEDFLQGMAAGADDYLTKPVDLDELQVRLASGERVVTLYRRLAQQNALLRLRSEHSFAVARVDALTRVGNRLSMDEDLKVLWGRAHRYGHRYSLALCDVDRFKSLNDELGHVAGDEVLRSIASTIRAQLREGDSLYRYGGEEFAVVLPEQSLDEAAKAMERVRRAVQALPIATKRGTRHVTISFGVAELNRSHDASPEDWLGRADTALYRAKESGRNRVETDRPERIGP